MGDKKTPAPPHDYNIGGWRQTGYIRIRQRWLGAVVEEMLENREGIRVWEKTSKPFVLQRGV